MKFPRLNRTEWLIALLIGLNLITLALLFGNRRGHAGPRERPAEMRRALNLTEAQCAQFDTLESRFFQKTAPFYDDLNKCRREAIRASAQNPADSAALKTVVSTSARLHFQLDSLRLAHYLDLRTLCTPAQQEKLQEMFLRRIEERQQGGRGGRKSPRH